MSIVSVLMMSVHNWVSGVCLEGVWCIWRTVGGGGVKEGLKVLTYIFALFSIGSLS